MIWSLFSRDEATEILATHIPQGNEEDELEWTRTKSGRFTVKSGYWFLHNRTNNQDQDEYFWKAIWKSDIFPKWKHFIWKIMNNAMPLADNLIKRHISNINPTCSFCKSQSETLSHLFRDCEISQRIRRTFLGIVAAHGSHLSIQDWIRNFLNLFRKKKQKEERNIESDFISTLWGIWIH